MEEKIEFVRAVHGGTPESFFWITLENDQYIVKIYYIDFDFFRLRAEHKLNYDAISVSVKYKQDTPPFKIRINPGDLNKCLLCFCNPIVRYGEIGSLEKSIYEAKKLVQSIMAELHKEFGLPQEQKE